MFQTLENNKNQIETMIEDWEILSPNLTLLTIARIKDPCRPKVCNIMNHWFQGMTADRGQPHNRKSYFHKVWDLATKGREFHNYSSEERKQHLQSICILARLSLSNELLIMRTLKEMSEVVITYRQWY